MNKYLLTPNRKSTIGKATIKVQLDEPMIVLGSLIRIWVTSYLHKEK